MAYQNPIQILLKHRKFYLRHAKSNFPHGTDWQSNIDKYNAITTALRCITGKKYRLK